LRGHANDTERKPVGLVFVGGLAGIVENGLLNDALKPGAMDCQVTNGVCATTAEGKPKVETKSAARSIL
jgi:hypothetical protein